MRLQRWKLVFLFLCTMLITLAPYQHAYACGGMFSPNQSIQQNQERIILVNNGDGTHSAIIELTYVGSAEEFAWVLPIPEVIPASAVESIEGGTDAFNELQRLTDPQFTPPPEPACVEFSLAPGAAAPDGAVGGSRGVDVYSSGVTGPYSFDIIGSDDPHALIQWLQDNGYTVTPEMEPKIQPYIDAGMAFLAMKLRPGEDVSAIQPVKFTFHADKPVIPMRIAAVAATADMHIYVWMFAEQQAVPANYDQTEVQDSDIVFYQYGGNNYQSLLGAQINQAGGHAFVTEYAGSSTGFSYTEPLLQQLASAHPYLTRLLTVLSPEEMTIDPMFTYDGSRPDVSNVHDLSSASSDVWQMSCTTATEFWASTGLLCGIGALLCLIVAGIIVGIVLLIRRRRGAAPAAS